MKYQRAILGILNEYAKIKYSNVDGENRVVADRQNRRYQIITVGWEGRLFVFDVPMAMEIINGKVWIQQNMTEWDLGAMLEKSGISKKEIVLGFLTPTTREYTEYAVA